VQKGQQVEVQILKVEKGGKRISLSMKRLEDDPWDGVAERFEKGQEFKGTVVRKAEFGVFVEVEPGLEGLIHVSRLPYGKTIESDDVAEGLEVEGWVHEVDRKRRRLSLSMRPVAEGNPWQDINDRYPEGELVTGTVERVADFGAFIELEPGLTGLLPFSMLGGSGNPKRQYHAGKEVSVKVLAIDKSRKRISLGTEQSTAEGSNVDYKEYKKQQQEATGGLNAMAAALAKLKDQMPSA
jgi:small subunit ribosomal protein S1